MGACVCSCSGAFAPVRLPRPPSLPQGSTSQPLDTQRDRSPLSSYWPFHRLLATCTPGITVLFQFSVVFFLYCFISFLFPVSRGRHPAPGAPRILPIARIRASDQLSCLRRQLHSKLHLVSMLLQIGTFLHLSFDSNLYRIVTKFFLLNSGQIQLRRRMKRNINIYGF